MTEIPEHLLKRSRERRGALSGDDGASASGDNKPATTKSAAPATQQAAAPAGPQPRTAAPEPAAPEAPKPDSAVVSAFKSRRRIPGWAMLGLAFLPVWAFMYVRSVTTQPEELTGPLAVGAEQYSTCASCHGGAGGGGVGYAFAEGEVLETFPHIEDQLRFVYFGTEGYNLAGVEIYGNPDREGGPHLAGALGPMPAQGGSLTDYQILGVVCHERYALGGAGEMEEFDSEYELWCSEESPLFEALEAGTSTLADLHETAETEESIMPIGDTPVPGSPG